MRRRRGIMGLNGGAGIPIITATATGNPLTFETDIARPLKFLVIPLSLVQEGSGNPNPSNVRPISGWTGCNVTVTRKNQWNPITSVSGYINVNDGTITAAGSSTKEITSDYIPVPSGTEAISLGFNYNVSVKWKALGLYDANKNFIARPTIDNVSFGTIDISSYEGVAFCRACLRTYGNSNSNAYLAFGNDTTYEAYNGNTLPITWETDAGTVYGGSLTIHEDGTGTLVSDKLAVEFDGSSDESWKFETTTAAGKNAYIAMPSTVKSLQVTPEEMICSASPTNAMKATGTTYRAVRDACYISASRNFNYCWLDTLNITSAADFKSWLQDGHTIQVVATLINPVTYNLTAEEVGQIIAAIGQNNIWTDTNGTNTATYLKHQTT